MPPLPTPLYLPFQFSIGSQTSKFTAGVVTPTTRQKSGKDITLLEFGAENEFAVTTSAEEIVVSVKFKLVNPRQAGAEVFWPSKLFGVISNIKLMKLKTTLATLFINCTL